MGRGRGMGMGNDGGVIAAKRYLIKEKTEDRGARDKERRVQGFRWATCAMSAAPLREPIMADAFGNLFNKEAVLQYLLDKREIPAFAHIRSLKRDLVTLKLTRNPAGGSESTESSERHIADFVCPITLIEANGVHPFVAMKRCGCVLSEKAVRELATERCPCCDLAFRNEDVLKLCPTEEETVVIRLALEARLKGSGVSTSTTAAALALPRQGGAPDTTSATSGLKRKTTDDCTKEGLLIPAGSGSRGSLLVAGAGAAATHLHDASHPGTKRRRVGDADAGVDAFAAASTAALVSAESDRGASVSQRMPTKPSSTSTVGLPHKKDEHSLASLAAAEATRLFEQQRAKSAVFAQLFKGGPSKAVVPPCDKSVAGVDSNPSRTSIGPGGW